MYDVMAGIKVVEVAEHTFVPAAGMILADWGADVIKVERAQGGDASRHLKLPGLGDGVNPYFEAGNRGKRSIAIDLTRVEGRALLHQLIENADVFTTNLRRDAREKLGIEAAQVQAIKPSIIYARGTGYGLKGDMADDGGFDYPSMWSRAGAGYQQTPPDGEPLLQPGSFGDLGGGANLAGAIAAALFRRERTGKGAIVDNALYLMGTYMMSQSLLGESAGLPLPIVQKPQNAPMPLVNNYQTRDKRWLTLCLLMDNWWADFLSHIDREDLLDDERFSDGGKRMANNTALIHILNQEIAKRDYADWCERFKTLEGVWSPVQSPAEVLQDPQALANGFVVDVDMHGQGSYQTGSSPAQFDEQAIGELQAGPNFGQHTDEILREMGMDDTIISQLKASKVIK